MCRSMFSEKSGFWGLGVASLALLACAAPNDAHITKLSKSRGGDELARPTPVLATLLSYDVVAPRERAALLVEYCQRTKLAVASEAGITRCGPFLSRYEAALIAGLVPGGSTRVHDQYLDGATLEPWLRVGSPYARTPTYVGTRLVAGHRFALVTWEIEDLGGEQARRQLEAGPGEKGDKSPPAPEQAKGDATEPKPKPDARPTDKPVVTPPITEQELYEVVGAGPRFMTRLPWLDAQKSPGGLALVKLGDRTIYLEVKANHQKDTIAEKLSAFQWGSAGRDAVFERELLSLKESAKEKDEKNKDEASFELVVLRVEQAPAGLQLSTFKAIFTRRAEAKGVDISLNDWASARWRAASAGKDAPARLPDLVELESIDASPVAFESLETIE